MKMLILSLLFITTGYGQDKPKLTAYRVINPHDDGACSIKTLVAAESRTSFLTYVTAESGDTEMINNLVELKKKAKRWKNSECGCNGKPGLQWGSIPNMFVIEKQSGNDTIYTNHDNTQIIFPEEESGYHDEKGLLQKALTGKIKEFFNLDFDKKYLRHWFVGIRDSVSYEKVWFRGHQLYGITEEKFKAKFPFAEFISLDTVTYHSDRGYLTSTSYRLGNDTLYFSHERLLKSIIANDHGWTINGITVDDPENKFVTACPSSSQIKIFNAIRFEDIKRKYYYPIYFSDDKGSARFHIKDGVIKRLHIGFRYPEPE